MVTFAPVMDGKSTRAALRIAAIGATGFLASCDSPRNAALRELSTAGIEVSGRSLVHAVSRRDRLLTCRLLESGVYTEQRDPHGRTPLAIAVDHGDLEGVAALINAGANVNAKHPDGSSILGSAIAAGDPSLISALLAAGARTDGLMPDGDHILPSAIRHGRLDLVRNLMTSGADPHLRDSHGNPLLHVAMQARRRDLVESLIDLGADPGATNAKGETTIHLALQHGWTNLVPKLAAAGADPNALGLDGFTLLERSLESGNTDQTVLFLKVGADPWFAPPESGRLSPFEAAFEACDLGRLSLLLDHRALPSDGLERWAGRAFERRNLPLTRFFLARGARLDADQSCLLPVEVACAERSADFLKLFLDYRFPIGRALEACCLRGDHEMAGLLLAAGADPSWTLTPSRVTPLSIALGRGHDRLAALLIQYGADPDLLLPEGQPALHLAIAKGCHRTVRAILDRGGDPNAPFLTPVSPDFLKQVRPGVMRWVLRMDRNATPLMLAADSGNVQTARYLMRAGAKSNVRTRVSSLWPINFASRRGDVRMMRLFLGRNPHEEERWIEIRLSEQRARVFDAKGQELLATKVSTGRKGYATPTGEFVITNKHRDWTSTLYHARMPYFQRLSCGDFGLHQGVVPGYPASHGCIRVPAGTAAKLFALTQTGDRVRIVP